MNDRKREVEEKAKQLEQVASLSALIAGFALVAMVEINIPSTPRYLCFRNSDCVFGRPGGEKERERRRGSR